MVRCLSPCGSGVLDRECSIHIPLLASPPVIRDQNRMLMSARPGRCGEYQTDSIAIAISLRVNEYERLIRTVTESVHNSAGC